MLGAAVASRTLRSATTVLSWQPQGSDGEPVDPGVVTVGITRADSSELVAAGTATSGAGSSPRTFTLTPSQTATLDILTATWKVGATVYATTRHEIVGGFYFTKAELIDAEPTLSAVTLAKAIAARSEVETFIEAVCGCAFVPRFSLARGFVRDGSVNFDGDSTITLHPWLRSIQWGRYWSTDSISSTALTATDIAAVLVNDLGVISVPYGDHVYEIGYEHGTDVPPPDIKAVSMALARMATNRSKSGVPDRAITMTGPDGASFNFGRVGTKWRPTGVEWIDEILLRPEYNFRLAGTVL